MVADNSNGNFIAKDAEDLFGNHPDEPLRHAIQSEGVFEKKPETTETAESDRDPAGPRRGPVEEGNGLVRGCVPEAVSLQ